MKLVKKRSIVWGAAASLIFTAALSAATSTDVSAIERSSRLWGENRYKTSVEVSKNGWGTSDYAIIVRGDEFADALCAAPLAQKYNAPILLNGSDVLNDDIKNEIQRLNVKNVIIIGGSGVISNDVENELRKIASVERISGQDRYETSVKVAQKVGISSKIVIASGEDFPDALSVASIAAEKQMPILLTPKAELPNIVKEYINKNKIELSYIIGGEGAVSTKVENEVPKPKRLSGKDRYETNTAILNEFKNELNFDNIYVAAGDGVVSSSGKKEGFADALSGAPLAARNSAPIILTYNTVSDPVKGFMDSSKAMFTPETKVIAIGGNAVVSENIMDTLDGATTLSFIDCNEKGKEYDENMKESENNVEISADNIVLKNEKIKGNLYIYGNNVKLQNLIIDGTVFVDPGDNGTTYLDNVKASNIKIRSGAESSIHFNGVTADNLQVESSDNNKSVRIEASGTMSIKNTIILSNVSIDGGQDLFGNVLVSNTGLTNKTIELMGNYTKPVVVNGSATIKALAGANVSKLQLQPDNADSLVTLKGKFTDIDVKKQVSLEIKENSNITGTLTTGASTELKIAGGSSLSNLQVPEGALGIRVGLSGSGEVQNIQVKDKEAVVAIPTGIKVTGKIEAVNKGNITAQDPKVAGSVEVKPVDQIIGGTTPISGGGGGGYVNTDTTKQAAIESTNTLIAALPNSRSVNLENAQDTKVKLKTAEEAIASAIEKGAVNADFIGLEKIESLKVKLGAIDKLIIDQEQLSINYNGTDLSINLPSESSNGSIITWSSSSEAIDAASAKVTRSFDKDEKVTLTASLTQNIYDKDGNIIDSVSIKKEIDVTVKKVGMTLSVNTIGKNISITLLNTEIQSNQEVKLALYDKLGNLSYEDQKSFVDGKVVFSTQLDDGTYTGKIETQLFSIDIKKFTVDKTSALINNTTDFDIAMKDENISSIELTSTVEPLGEYKRINTVTIKAANNMNSMFNIKEGIVNLTNVIIDAQEKDISDTVVSVLGDAQVTFDNVIIKNLSAIGCKGVSVEVFQNAKFKAVNSQFINVVSGIQASMNGDIDIENCKFTGTSQLGCAINQIQGEKGQTPSSIVNNNTITGFNSTDNTNSSAGIYIAAGNSEISGNTINDCFDGISVKEGTTVNGITGGINLGLKLKELNPQTVNNKRANVIVFNDSSIIYKDIASAFAQVVSVNGDKVTIRVTCDNGVPGDVTLKLLDSNGNIAYTDQKTIANGQCTFEETLLNGEYTGSVQIPGVKTSLTIEKFTVNKPGPVTANVAVNGKNVKITISSTKAEEGANVAIIIYRKDDDKGITAYIDQGKIINGACVFSTKFDVIGTYYGTVKVGEFDTVSINEFNINTDVITSAEVVSINGDKVTIHVMSSVDISGDATLKILDANGNIAQIGQIAMVNGECDFVVSLSNGTYTAIVKVPGVETPINVSSFTVN